MTVLDMLRASAARWGVPADLAVSVARAESSLNPAAVSSKGAIGVMQLMPRTAAALGVDPWDPYQNVEGGVRYLRQLFDRFGNWEMAVAAYNAGPTRVASGGALPAETSSYLAQVFGRLGFPTGGTVSPGPAGTGGAAGFDWLWVAVAAGGLSLVMLAADW